MLESQKLTLIISDQLTELRKEPVWVENWNCQFSPSYQQQPKSFVVDLIALDWRVTPKYSEWNIYVEKSL